jgi:hypothetical protein
LFRRGRSRLDRQLALADLQDAMGRAETPAEPPSGDWLCTGQGKSKHLRRPGEPPRPRCGAGNLKSSRWGTPAEGRYLDLCKECVRLWRLEQDGGKP